MCGIAGIHVFNPEYQPKWSKMEHAVDDLLLAIDHRGGDATGYVAIGNEGELEFQKASCDAKDFYKERRSIPFNTRSILLHTRMATQGSAAFPENNHPVRRGSVYVVHNGHIWNDWDIFKKAKRTRHGQVDSEAIAALIAKYGIMNTHKAMEEISGAAAIGVVDETRPGLMALARGSSSPLMFYRNENVAVFASEKQAVRRAWQTLYGTPPNEKNIVEFEEGTAYYLNGDIIHKKFTPDDYYHYVRSSYVVSGTSSYKTGSKWNDSCEVEGCWRVSSFTTAGSVRLCKDHQTEYINSPADFLYEKSLGLHGKWGDGEGVILCNHGYKEHNCGICSLDDDDEFGSFLPIARKDVKPEDFVSAKRCELCDKFFPEDEMSQVKDWDDEWIFCSSCLDEMSEVVTDCELTRPTRIHEEKLDDVSSVNYVLNGDGEYYLVEPPSGTP